MCGGMNRILMVSEGQQAKQRGIGNNTNLIKRKGASSIHQLFIDLSTQGKAKMRPWRVTTKDWKTKSTCWATLAVRYRRAMAGMFYRLWKKQQEKDKADSDAMASSLRAHMTAVL
jgi:hypothetical protein